MRRYRHTKILATLGPASASRERIAALFEAGADVFRLNFSHGTHDGHRAVHDANRAVEAETGRPIGALADLQGPKLRLGARAGGQHGCQAGRPARRIMERRALRALVLICIGVAAALSASPAAATPACDLLRLCSAALADEMAGGPEAACGDVWPVRVIAQYRRMSVTDFEAGGAAHACSPTFQAIAHNAFMMHQNGRLCRLPIACKPENADDLPALPGE